MYIWIANPCCFLWMWFANNDSIHISHRKAVAFRSTGHLTCNTHHISSTSHYPELQIFQHCNELFNLKFPSCKWWQFKLLIKAFVEHFLRYFVENVKDERDPQKWIHLAMAPRSCKTFSSHRAQALCSPSFYINTTRAWGKTSLMDDLEYLCPGNPVKSVFSLSWNPPAERIELEAPGVWPLLATYGLYNLGKLTLSLCVLIFFCHEIELLIAPIS